MKRLIFFLVLLVSVSIHHSSFAQADNAVDDAKKSGAILSNLDSLMNVWIVKTGEPGKNRRSANIRGYKPEDVPVFSDSVYTARIKKIESPLPLVYNSAVKGFIDLYAVRKRNQVERMLGLAEYYFPIFEEILDKHNVPVEIKYLSIVESALNTHAVSKVGATGLWQFMYTTGVLYDLNINSFVDQRRDPYKATEAAVTYLKGLHDVFGDWFLAIAAYNCGPGNVNKAIRRSGGKKTFWEIYRYLPEETRGYVPAFIAAAYVFTYHQEHNLYPAQINMPALIDTIAVTKEIAFEPIAKVLNVPIELIRDLNPQYKRDVIPARSKNYILRLPADRAAAFVSYKDSIYNIYTHSSLSSNLAANDSASTEEEIASRRHKKKREYNSQAANKMLVHYTVKSGDNINLVADVFDVSVYNLKHWNKMSKSGHVKTGQKLKIMVPAEKFAYYKKINSMTGREKKRLLTGGYQASENTTEVADNEQATKGAQGGKKGDDDNTDGSSKKESAKGKKTPSQEKQSREKEKVAGKTTGKGKQKEEAKVKAKPAEKETVKETAREKEVPAASYYVVQKGDTLWSIAQRFPGVTVDDIKKVNNLSDTHAIKVGQKIKISKA